MKYFLNGSLNLILAIIFFLIFQSNIKISAQSFDEGSAGRLFVIAFPATQTDKLDNFSTPDKTEANSYLCMFSQVAQTVSIKRPDGLFDLVKVLAKKPYIYDIVSKNKLVAGTIDPFIQTPDVVNAGRTFRIESPDPILVYCYMETKTQAEAWAPVPCEQWGKEYYASTVPGTVIRFSSRGNNIPAPSQIITTSLDTNTLIYYQVPGYGTVNQAAVTPQGARNVVFIGQDDSYAIHSAVSMNGNLVIASDIGGTKITSEKPFGVISGNMRSNGGFQPDTVFRGITRNSHKNMLIEAMSPIQTLGKEFVFMPTWDGKQELGLAPQTGGALRKNEIVRFIGTSANNTVVTSTDSYTTTGLPLFTRQISNSTGSVLPNNQFIVTPTSSVFSTFEATYFKSDKPTEAYSTSSAYAEQMFGGLTLEGAQTSAFTQAPYMVELVPREQWIKSGPFFTPETAMDNYLNIVTDSATASSQSIEITNNNGSASKIIFTKKVKGSDLVWATIKLQMNTFGFLNSSSGKFYAVCYGLSRDNSGFENQRPRAQYLEYSSRSYGYPIAPNKWYLQPHDSVKIDTSYTCPALDVNASILNLNKSGFRSVLLENNNNSKILFVKPTSYFRVIGDSNISFKVVPVNQTKDASATVVIMDRTGYSWKLQYNYYSEKLTLLKDTILMGEVTPQIESKLIEFEAVNNNSKTVVLTKVDFVNKLWGFTFVSSEPPLPATLKPGEKVLIKISQTPPPESARKVFYRDSILLQTECTQTIATVYSLRGNEPWIYIDDLNFGDLLPGESRTKTLQVCNIGGGIVAFKSPGPGRDVVEWLNRSFSISQAELVKLRNAKIGHQECIDVEITFKSDTEGYYVNKSQFYSTAAGRRDTSYWTAFVKVPGPRVSSYDFSTKQVTTPLNSCTKNDTTKYETIVKAWNNGSGEYVIKNFELIGKDAQDGYFSFGNKPKIQIGDKLRGKDSTEDNFRYQLVYFSPKDEREYSCKLRLVTGVGDTVESIIRGTGIESHVKVDPVNFGLVDSFGVYYYKTLSVKSVGTRPFSISGITIQGDFEISFDPLFPLPKPDRIKTLAIGESFDIPVRFRASKNGKKSANVCVVGDHSKCDDSCTVINVELLHIDSIPPKSEAIATKVNFKDVISCSNDSSEINVTNTGDAVLLIKTALLTPNNPAFIVSDINPTIIRKGEKVSIPVSFYPKNDLPDSADVLINCFDSTGTKVLTTTFTKLYGKGFSLITNTSISNINSPKPEGLIPIPVLVNDNSADTGNVSSLKFTLTYQTNCIILANQTDVNTESLTKGTLIDGWKGNVLSNIPGTLSVIFTAPQGEILKGKGTLLNLEFGLFLGQSLTSKITYTLEQNEQVKCVKFTTNSANVSIDSVCGSSIRLIELTNNNYSLDQNKPNPFNPSTNISFTLGLDGYSSIEIFNSIGEKVETLVNTYLKSGSYVIEWDAAAYPSGLYYYTLHSGSWRKTNSMLLQK
ncbi:MAG: IgGFc-binding protein [Chlorobiota bacterium]|nr:IgGFc-binding protein [Chlorobiota bacterium]QQS66758.1 MAG: IgGFc-binding protein [Chlorobiota bacterium]